MNPPIFAAPRFRSVHAEFSALATDPGSGETGLILDPSGRLEMVSNLESVEQSLALLLSTRPGERVMRPQYGCDLHGLVFAPNDDTTAGLAAHYVRKAVQTWEPRVELLAVDAVRDQAAPYVLNITLSYRLRSTGERSGLTYVFPLT
jgi:Bacteriophage baseplate protein W